MTADVSRASSELASLPSLSNTAGPSTVSSMPASPRSSSPGREDKVKIVNGDAEAEENTVDAGAVEEEMKDAGMSDPEVSSRLAYSHRTRAFLHEGWQTCSPKYKHVWASTTSPPCWTRR